MARTKVQIEVSELQDAINQLEAVKLFSSPHKLYEAVAQTPWARALGATPVMVYLRVKEVNADPSNPGIIMKVKAARRVGPREPGDQGENRSVKTGRAKATGVTFAGLDLLMDTFLHRGVEITGVEKLVTSSQKSSDENRAIMLAWADLRDKLGLPKLAKKAASLVNEAEVPIIESPTVVEQITESVDPVIAVTEEMPDGGLVPLQTEVEVEPSGEPEIILDVTPVELVDSVEAPVPMLVVPRPIQVTSVRPMPSCPTPVRSSVPPRPMPVAPY